MSEDIDMTYNELKRIITDNELYTQNEEANEMIEQKGDLFVLSLVDRGEMRNCELITDENLACAKYLSRIIGGYRRANCKGTLEVGKLYILRNWVNRNEYIIIAVDDVADYITEHGTVMKDVTSVRLSIIKDLKDAIDGDDYMLRLSYSIACRLVNYYAKSLFKCSICIGAFEGFAGGNAGPIIISEYDLTVLLREQYG